MGKIVYTESSENTKPTFKERKLLVMAWCVESSNKYIHETDVDDA